MASCVKTIEAQNKYSITAGKTKVKINIIVTLFGLEPSSTLDSPEEACRLTTPLVSNSETCSLKLLLGNYQGTT